MNESKSMTSFVDGPSQSLQSSSHFITPERDSLSRLFDDGPSAAESVAQNQGHRDNVNQQQQM